MMIGNLAAVLSGRDASAQLPGINLSETLYPLNEMRPLVSNKNLLLSSAIHDHLPVKQIVLVYQECCKIYSVTLLNLLEKVTLTRSATLHEGKISVEVEDSGRGISLNDQEHFIPALGQGKSRLSSHRALDWGFTTAKKSSEAHDGKNAFTSTRTVKCSL